MTFNSHNVASRFGVKVPVGCGIQLGLGQRPSLAPAELQHLQIQMQNTDRCFSRRRHAAAAGTCGDGTCGDGTCGGGAAPSRTSSLMSVPYAVGCVRKPQLNSSTGAAAAALPGPPNPGEANAHKWTWVILITLRLLCRCKVKVPVQARDKAFKRCSHHVHAAWLVVLRVLRVRRNPPPVVPLLLLQLPPPRCTVRAI